MEQLIVTLNEDWTPEGQAKSFAQGERDFAGAWMQLEKKTRST